jgi:hypothetical protein
VLQIIDIHFTSCHTSVLLCSDTTLVFLSQKKRTRKKEMESPSAIRTPSPSSARKKKEENTVRSMWSYGPRELHIGRIAHFNSSVSLREVDARGLSVVVVLFGGCLLCAEANIGCY